MEEKVDIVALGELLPMIQIIARLFGEQRVCSEKNEICHRIGRCHEGIG